MFLWRNISSSIETYVGSNSYLRWCGIHLCVCVSFQFVSMQHFFVWLLHAIGLLG